MADKHRRLYPGGKRRCVEHLPMGYASDQQKESLSQRHCGHRCLLAFKGRLTFGAGYQWRSLVRGVPRIAGGDQSVPRRRESARSDQDGRPAGPKGRNNSKGRADRRRARTDSSRDCSKAQLGVFSFAVARFQRSRWERHSGYFFGSHTMGWLNRQKYSLENSHREARKQLSGHME